MRCLKVLVDRHTHAHMRKRKHYLHIQRPANVVPMRVTKGRFITQKQSLKASLKHLKLGCFFQPSRSNNFDPIKMVYVKRT